MSNVNMRNQFYKLICNVDNLDGDVDLLVLEKLLEKRLKIFFNAIATIIAIQATKTYSQHQKKDKERKQINSFQTLTTQLPNKSKQFTLCFNCLSKAHILKECQSEFRCRVDVCRQKHHNLLHKELLDNQNGN